MIKLLIVDDSALMRRQLNMVFAEQGDFEICLARNGKDAVEENLRFQPDVVTLDINMPEMDGLTALSLMMAQRPVPTVMVSSLTEQGALATFEALALGAVDYITKPGGTVSLSLDVVKKELVQKVRAAVRAHVKAKRAAAVPSAPPAVRPPIVHPAPRPAGDGIVIIGVSTGGPGTLEEILPFFPADFPYPILVAQHMPATFTAPFSVRLNTLCELQVVEANRPMPLEAGVIYIGKGGADMIVTRRVGVATVMPKPENNEFVWHPSVELLGRSVLEHYNPTKITAIMLTGMGYDGADAFAEIRKRGGYTIAESQESCVIFGMPAELIARNGATVTLPAKLVTQQVLARLNR